jgi:hypothetical protein
MELWTLSGCSASLHIHTVGVSPSVRDVDRYVIIIELLDSIFDALPILYADGKFKYIYTGLFLI